ncbi:MAG: hypothetical protein FGF50_01550 [Candidatus Brockarchaeota archaeon]|nr:hypothetical protein [Candidatus Brockarchaeota archaeon]
MGRIRIRRSNRKTALVFNSTPLIYLAKAGIIKRLTDLPFRLVTTRAVYQEVVEKGVEKHAEEVNELRDAFKSHIIQVVAHVNEDVVKKLKNSGIHYGEATVISLSIELDGIAVMDDKRGRHVAKTLGVRVSSTPHVIIQLVKRGALTKQEGRQVIDRIIKEGWYCSIRSYAEIINAIEKA